MTSWVLGGCGPSDTNRCGVDGQWRQGLCPPVPCVKLAAQPVCGRCWEDETLQYTSVLLSHQLRAAPHLGLGRGVGEPALSVPAQSDSSGKGAPDWVRPEPAAHSLPRVNQLPLYHRTQEHRILGRGSEARQPPPPPYSPCSCTCHLCSQRKMM